MSHLIITTLIIASTIGCHATSTLRKGVKDKTELRRKLSSDTLQATLGVYPGYTGSTGPVTGTVTVRFNDDGSFLFKTVAEGLTNDCTDCGVHIHEGTTCDDAGSVGGHYWTPATDVDPWTTAGGAVYNADASGSTTTAYVLESGYPYAGNIGHAVVIHDDDGTRIACGVLEAFSEQPVKTLVASMGNYPGNTDDGVDVSGEVEVQFFEDETFRFNLDLEGLETTCEECGIHIHAGMSCDDSAMVLGHYWDAQDFGADDPWTSENGAYYTTSDAEAERSFYLDEGYGWEDNVDHAVVVHSSTGSRIGCGVLKVKNEGCSRFDFWCIFKRFLRSIF